MVDGVQSPRLCSSLSLIFVVGSKFKITIEQLMYRHQHKSPGLWSRNFKSQCFKIVKVFKVIRLKCSQFESFPQDISSLRSQDEKDSKLAPGPIYRPTGPISLYLQPTEPWAWWRDAAQCRCVRLTRPTGGLTSATGSLTRTATPAPPAVTPTTVTPPLGASITSTTSTPSTPPTTRPSCSSCIFYSINTPTARAGANTVFYWTSDMVGGG